MLPGLRDAASVFLPTVTLCTFARVMRFRMTAHALMRGRQINRRMRIGSGDALMALHTRDALRDVRTVLERSLRRIANSENPGARDNQDAWHDQPPSEALSHGRTSAL